MRLWCSIHEINISSAPAPVTVELESNNWTLSASSDSAQADVLLAIDDNDSTCGTTWRQVQTPGQYFEIDLSSQETFDEIILDSAASPNDHPRGYSVYVSSTPFGTNLGAVVAQGAGSSDGLTTINFNEQSARYIRIVQTSSII